MCVCLAGGMHGSNGSYQENMETCDPGWNGTVVKIVLVDTVGITGDDKQWRHIAAGIVMVLMIICGVIGKIRLHSFKIVIHVVVGGLVRRSVEVEARLEVLPRRGSRVRVPVLCPLCDLPLGHHH